MADIDISQDLTPQATDRIALFRGETPAGGTCTYGELLAGVMARIDELTGTITEAQTELSRLRQTVDSVLIDVSQLDESLSVVARSGSYDDLKDKPSIPDTADCFKAGQTNLPSADNAYDLGSTEKRLRAIHAEKVWGCVWN